MSRFRRIGRKPAVRSPAARIVIATEGKVTEPEYLKAFNRTYENSSVKIDPIPVGGDPRTVVERAIEQKEKSKIEQRYSKAVERSDDSLQRRSEEGEPGGNPSTTVHQLTEFIRSLEIIM